MSNDAIENGTPAPEAASPKAKRKPSKKAKPSKLRAAGKTAAKAKSERANKKAEVISLMKRAKGATLAEIMKARGWQTHTVRGFVTC